MPDGHQWPFLARKAPDLRQPGTAHGFSAHFFSRRMHFFELWNACCFFDCDRRIVAQTRVGSSRGLVEVHRMTRVLLKVSCALALIAGGACVGTVGDVQGTSSGGTTGHRGRERDRRHDGHRRHDRHRRDDRHGRHDGHGRHDRHARGTTGTRRHDRHAATRRYDGHRRHDGHGGTTGTAGRGGTTGTAGATGAAGRGGTTGTAGVDRRRRHGRLHDHRDVDDGHDPDGRHRHVHDQRHRPHQRGDPLRSRVDAVRR